MPVVTAGGKRYFVTFIDDATRYASVYLLKNKSDMSTAFVDFVSSAPHGLRGTRLRSDSGSEYKASNFQALLKQRGITHEPTAPYTPEHNGVAERLNRTINTIARSLPARRVRPRSSTLGRGRTHRHNHLQPSQTRQQHQVSI
jgi:transposase InsO family protein